jgi:hypothetical protein
VFLEVCSLGSFGFNCIYPKLACSSPPALCPHVQLLLSSNIVSYNDALIHRNKVGQILELPEIMEKNLEYDICNGGN